MMKKVNFWSFISSLVCLVLFLLYFLLPAGFLFFYVHPLTVLLYITLIVFFLGVWGLSGVHDWKGMIRSLATLIITLGLSMFLLFILFFGSLLS